MAVMVVASATALPPLHIEGLNIVDDTGTVVPWRGANLGSWLLMEMWMLEIGPTGPDLDCDMDVRTRLLQRFGPERRDALLRVYRENYIAEADFDFLAECGFSCIRLPFFSEILESDTAPFVYKERGWELLDAAVSNCAARGMYCILDMHGTPGGHSADHTTGQAGRDMLFYEKEFQDRLVALWGEIAKRYRDEPAVAAYNLINEPWGAPGQDALLLLHDRIIREIRRHDTSHIIIVEHSGPGRGMGELPDPREWGWTNIVYQDHPYAFKLRSFEDQRGFVNRLIPSFVEFEMSRGVPLFLGEFHPPGHAILSYYLRQFNAMAWDWTVWTYKCSERYGHWGLAKTRSAPDLAKDSFTEISNAFARYALEHCAVDAVQTSLYTRYALAPWGRAVPPCRRFSLPMHQPDIADARNGLVHHAGEGLVVTRNGELRCVLPRKEWARTVAWLKANPTDFLRARVDDTTGTWFNLALADVAGRPGGKTDYHAEVKWGFFRAPVSGDLFTSDARGVMAIARVNIEKNEMAVSVYRAFGEKNNGAAVSPVLHLPWRPGVDLGLWVGAERAALAHAGSNVWEGAHRAAVADWPGDAFAGFSAERVWTQDVSWVSFSDMIISREITGACAEVTRNFRFPDGMPLRALQDEWAVRQDDGNAVVESNRVVLTPSDHAWSRVWLAPMCDAQNPARVRLDDDDGGAATLVIDEVPVTTNADGADVQISTVFYPHMCTCAIWDYEGRVLTFETRYAAENGGRLRVRIFDHNAPESNGRLLGETDAFAFVPGAPLTLRVTPRDTEVMYNGEVAGRFAHGMDIAKVFPDGACVQVDVQHVGDARGACVLQEISTDQ